MAIQLEYYFRIEYNDSIKMFHFEDDLEKPYIDGWFPICEYLRYEECVDFVEFMNKKYGEDFPHFFRVYLEFQLFQRLN